MPSYSDIIAMAKANSERGAKHLQDMKQRKHEETERSKLEAIQKDIERKRAEEELSKRRKQAEERNRELANQRKDESKRIKTDLNKTKVNPNSRKSPSKNSSDVLTREEKRKIKQMKEFGEYNPRKKFETEPKNKHLGKSNELIPLNQKKRDTRTVDEIQRDLKNKRHKTLEKPKSSSTNRTSQRKNEQYSSSSDQDDDQDEGAINNDNVSQDIWKLFGKDKSKYLERDYNSDESDMGMEATNEDVLHEELKSSRFGKQEDDKEAADLRRHELEKKRKKLSSK